MQTFHLEIGPVLSEGTSAFAAVWLQFNLWGNRALGLGGNMVTQGLRVPKGMIFNTVKNADGHLSIQLFPKVLKKNI